MNSFTKQKQIQKHRKQTYAYQRGEGMRINWEFEMNRCTTTIYKTDKQQGLTV